MKIQTRQEEPNAFARVGRFAKVSAMIRLFDSEIRSRGGNPEHDPFGVIPLALESWPALTWEALALRAGAATKPSAKSKALFIAEYRERSARAAKVIETTGEVLPVAEVA
jgi:hypothetical protein